MIGELKILGEVPVSWVEGDCGITDTWRGWCEDGAGKLMRTGL